MRIATSGFYDRATSTMGSLTAKADALQTQVSTGKRINAPSDDAGAYRQLTGIKQAATDQKTDEANIKLAQSLLDGSDTALSGVETQLQRVREIAMTASNGTLSAEQKAAFGTELDAIVEDLVRLANTSDARGQPLFSGSSDAPPYAADVNGVVQYSGTGEAGAIPIGDGAKVQATTSGTRIFSFEGAAGPTDIFAVVQGLATNLRTDGTTGDALKDIDIASSTVIDARASIGARGARLDVETARLADTSVSREESRSNIEDVDTATAITQLQKTLTVLQATQASFSKLTALSLFDYIR